MFLFAQETSMAPLTSDQVVQRMVERNEQRAQALESYRGTRIYNLEYHGLASKSATLVVAMTYRRPERKEILHHIVESGSELLQGASLEATSRSRGRGHAGGTTPTDGDGAKKLRIPPGSL